MASHAAPTPGTPGAAPQPGEPAGANRAPGAPAGTPEGPSPLRQALTLAAWYAEAALLSLYVSRQPGSLATIWYANAVAVAYIAGSSARRMPLLLAATAAANLLSNVLWGDAWAQALRFVTANLAEVLLGALLVRRSRLAARALHSPGGLLALLALGGVLPQWLGATLGALLLAGPQMGGFGGLWLVWYEGAVVGALSMLPLAVAVRGRPWADLRPELLTLRTAALLMLALGTVLLSFSFLPFPFVYTTLPLLLAAMLLPFVGAAAVTLASSVTMAALLGLGLFAPPPTLQAWQQVFIYLALAVTLVPAQLLAATLAELRDGHRRLAERSAALHHANERLEQFVRVAAHDLREPLNTVVQFSALIAQDYGAQLPAPGQRYLRMVNQAGERMRGLLDGVLHYARAHQRPAEAPQAVPLDPLFATLREALAARLDASGAELHVGPLPAVLGNASLLSLLFQNLLVNALKFVPPGRVPQVHCSARVHGGQAHITVADNGIGISQADQAKLFQPFRRRNAGRAYEGSGLGLSLCRQIAEASGGDIRLRSVPGRGSAFTVRLPLAP